MKTNDEVLKTYIKRIRESSPDDADSLAVLKQLRFDSGQVADVFSHTFSTMMFTPKNNSYKFTNHTNYGHYQLRTKIWQKTKLY